MKWFEVDKQGLSKLLERRGKQFALYELVQNAWDEKTTRVDVILEKSDKRGYVDLVVEDDNPEGFADLSHAFTLFAESNKKSDAEKRGRFNLGEKLVLALCQSAEIITTTGSVFFNEDGRRLSRRGRVNGSEFSGYMRMTNDEFDTCCAAMLQLIPPHGIETYFNGELIPAREQIASASATLLTEVADADGVLRRSQRITTIEVYEPRDGEEATLYEMGIPVVVTGDRFHVDIGQKVPLNFDRDNVTPGYLGAVRSAVAEMTINKLTTDDANSTWVRDAFERHGDKFEPEVVDRLTTLRFGEKRVIYDLSDPEANALAVTKGYAVVYGSQLSRPEWDAVRRTGAILPAGQVTPSPKPFSPDGNPLKVLDEDKWTPGIRWFHEYARALAARLIPYASIEVTIANDFGWKFLGAYGSRHLYINVARAGYDWFDGPLIPINDFLIHEFGHEYAGNHLDERYYDALTRLGAKLVQVALDEPQLFQRKQESTPVRESPYAELYRQAESLIEAGRQDEVTDEMWDAVGTMESHLANKAYFGT